MTNQLQLPITGSARTPESLKRVEDKLRAIVQGAFRAAAADAAAHTLEHRRHQLSQRQAKRGRA